jgi:hypothetical protein
MKYRMLVVVICGLVLLGTAGNGSVSEAQQVQESSYQALSDKFFDLMKQGKTSDAVDYVFETNPALGKMTDESEQLKSQFASVGTLMGSYVSHTKLLETKVAGMFVYQHYFVAYQRQPISIRISYYKPGATWICYGLQFDAKLTDEIQKQSDERIPMDTK